MYCDASRQGLGCVLWTRSPNKEVENWKIRSVFKCFHRFCKFGKVRKTEETLANFSEKSKRLKNKRKEKKICHFTSALFSKDMLRIIKGFAPWSLFDCFEEKFYIHWSVGRSPRVHEVNPGRDPSLLLREISFKKQTIGFMKKLIKNKNQIIDDLTLIN